jgi:hypothetical protein
MFVSRCADYKRRNQECKRLLRLDYLSCVLTIASTVLIGRRKWQGWIIAAFNSVIICMIGVRTAQTGFIPANLFCLALYGYNIFQWRYGSPAPAHFAAPGIDQPVVASIAQRPRRSPAALPAMPRLASAALSHHARHRLRRTSLPEIRS